jgi:hypothetical protein
MSLPVFVNMITETDLTKERLVECWEKCNLKNKSEHIDTLLKLLHKKFNDRETIPSEETKAMCNRYTNVIIKKMIPYTKPHIEVLDDLHVNPATSIVFEKEGDEYVAVSVISMGNVHPLQLKHLHICVSNGWSFKTDRENISSPFRKT